jgi:hypothetical protein
MRISPKILALALVAALFGWLVRGIALDDPASPAVQVQPAANVRPPEEQLPPPPQLVNVGSPRESRGNRNLFAYLELERRVEPAPIAVVAPQPPQPLPAVVEPEPIAPPRPRFTWRYIGRFGPRDQPIAAFARDGEIRTLRTGDRIDEHFVLRSIGLESVEVEGVGKDIRTISPE